MFTDKGYQAPTQNEIRDEIIQKKREIDPDFRLDASTIDGMLTNIEAERDERIYQHTQAVYDARDPNKATGYDLDVICSLTGKVRSLGTPSSVTLRFTGVAGTIITEASIFDSGADSTQWRTIADATIAMNKMVDVVAVCTENGANDVAIGDINRIVKSARGLQSVTNITVATLGLDAQSDESLRIERKKSVASGGSNTIDSMYAALYSIDELQDALILNNNEAVADANGVPARSIAVIAHGGSDNDVAKAIFRNRSIGCAFHAAATPVTVVDVYDQFPKNKQNVTFSRPIYIDMIIAITIKNDGTLPSGADALIYQAILDYAQGNLQLAGGFNSSGYSIGEDVAVNQLQTPIQYVLGRYGNSYIEAIDVNGQSFGQVVSIAFNEMSRFNTQNMGITLT